jgi:predicted ATPase
VGEGAASEHSVLGETPNLAARLQGLAPPGSILIAEGTRRLARGLFAYEPSGPHVIKGLSAPVTAWRVLGESDAESRFAATRRPEAGAPLVGREAELALLLDRWERARESEGQVVLLGGEPGIGKSRLIHALRERVGDAQAMVHLQSSPHYANTAFHPFAAELRRAAGFARGDPEAVRLDKLEGWLASAGVREADAAPLLGALLSLPVEARYPSLEHSPGRRKDRTVEILLDRLRAGAAHGPLLLVVEDLHWADPTTLDVLGSIVDAAPSLPWLAVFTHRPEFVPPWPGRGHVTGHSLTRLGRRQVGEIISALGGGAIPSNLVGEIVERTDGVPLFVEELTRSVLEAAPISGPRRDRGEKTLAVPSSLKDSLAARLDRLGAVKRVAQVASVIGREFGPELLGAACGLDDTALGGALDQLEGAGVLVRHGRGPEALYTFRHALILDAAYDSLLKTDRASLHRTLARVIEARFADLARREPEVLAHHFAAAGRADEAIGYWQAAARAARERSAYVESMAHLQAALPPPNLRDRARRAAVAQRHRL